MFTVVTRRNSRGFCTHARALFLSRTVSHSSMGVTGVPSSVRGRLDTVRGREEVEDDAGFGARSTENRVATPRDAASPPLLRHSRAAGELQD